MMRLSQSFDCIICTVEILVTSVETALNVTWYRAWFLINCRSSDFYQS